MASAALDITFPGNLAQVRTAVDLRAVPYATVSDGELWVVSDLGLFQYDANSVAVDDGTTVLKPSGLTILQAGRWLLSGLSALSAQIAAYGATLAAGDGSAKIGFLQKGSGAVLRTILAKEHDVFSILDFGALGNNTGNQSTIIQVAIDAVSSLGGGTIVFPSGVYRTTTSVNLKSNVKIRGDRGASIHWINTTTGNAFQAIGTGSSIIKDIHVEGLAVYGDTSFGGGVPTVLNGSAFNFQFVSNSSVRDCNIIGFADNAVAFANGDLNVIDGVTADQCGQSLAIYGTTRGGYGNKVINSTVTRNGTFNAIHSEGRAAGGTQDVLGTQFLNNTVDDSYGHCINGENSPGIVIAGNRVRKAGPGVESDLIHGIFLFGSPNSTVNGNVSTDNVGRGILIGPNCGNVSINGNTTANNTGGSCLLTDGGGVAASNNVAIGFNAFGEGPVVQSGNVSVRNLTPSIQFTNTPNVDPLTLDWYEEGIFTPVIVGTTSAGSGTYTAQAGRFTRIGNVVNLWITIGWSAHTGTGNMRLTGLPYVNNAAVKSTLELAPNGLALPANSTLHTVIIEGQSYIDFYTHQPTAGDQTMLPMDSAVPEMTLAGAYRA